MRRTRECARAAAQATILERDEYKLKLDEALGRTASSLVAKQQQAKKVVENDRPVSSRGHDRDAGKQLDVQG